MPVNSDSEEDEGTSGVKHASDCVVEDMVSLFQDQIDGMTVRLEDMETDLGKLGKQLQQSEREMYNMCWYLCFTLGALVASLLVGLG